MKNFIKKIILPILVLIKKILIFLKKNVLPNDNSEIQNTPYNLYRQEEIINSYNHFKKHFKSSVLINQNKIGEYSINLAKKNDENLNCTYIEFGVWKGTTINFFSNHVKKIYGFDSFDGLKEDWVGHRIIAGRYRLSNDQMPNFNKNVIIVKGLIQDTLENFLKENNPKINFVHVDIDTYETCYFLLEKIKPYLINNSVILFDELYNHPGWDVGEYKALKELFKEEEFKFKAFSADRTAVAIQIKK